MNRPSTTARGQQAETLAIAHLESRGYEIIRRNFRAAGGEIDVIAWDGEILCFVEVRSRCSLEQGDPLETIDRRKIRRVARAAHAYLETVARPWPEMRFDAVGILLRESPEIELVRDAFDEDG